METLRELIEEYGANGVIHIDDGNGSAGPTWVEWNDDIEAEWGHIAMHLVAASNRAYEGDDEYSNKDTLGDVARYVIRSYSMDELYASDWIIYGQGDNPYCFRLIF